MRELPSVTSRPGFVIAGACLVAGAVLQGMEAAVLWAVVGFFVGKSIQSLAWTWTGGPGA